MINGIFILTLVFTSLVSGVSGFIINNLVSKLKLKEKINDLKLQAYKDLLRTWVISRNVVIGYMLVRETTEGLKRKMEVRLKLDEAHVSSSALIGQVQNLL